MFTLTVLRALVAAFVLSLAGAAAGLAAPVDTGHVKAELVAQSEATPGGVVYLALHQQIAHGWHTYWRNPGDSGAAPEFTWALPGGWSVGDPVWPTPKRLKAGPLVQYGYVDDLVLPIPMTVPATAAVGSKVSIKTRALFLVCNKDTCLPEEATLSYDVGVTGGAPKADPVWGERIAKVLENAPKPSGLKAAFVRNGDLLKLSVVGPGLEGGDFSEAYFYPFDGLAIEHAALQTFERGPAGLTLTIPVGTGFQVPTPPTELEGVLALGAAAYEIDAKAGPLLPGAAGGGSAAGLAGGAAASDIGLPLALALAFLGGIVLNLMPCVFPILAMKAAALTRHAHAPAESRVQGAAYGAGVVVTFVALGAALIAARAAGETVGWGFQLQSPAVVGALSLVMLLVGLNLSGVFEVGLSVQGAGGSLANKEGPAGAFFTGILAVVVAAPCTAPFMAVALGYALTQGAITALLVFFALGLGLAAPFMALAFTPSLFRRLPRPGPWMDVLKRVLAFPMFGTAAWLAWVFTLQAGASSLARLFIGAIVIAFAAWLYGEGQKQQRVPLRRLLQGAAIPALVLAGFLVNVGSQISRAAGSNSTSTAALASQPFSPERLATLRASGKPVLVDFTAAWCVTCQVNERVALSSQKVADAFARNGAVYMVADWTNRDPTIAKVLAEHGRAGVPLYLLYGASGAEPVVLPQLLTEGSVIAALNQAARS